MARRRTLVSMLDDYRAEARLSPNPAHNAQAREAQVKLLQRVQDRLWEENDWGHLRIWRDVPLQNGQRYYDTPPEIAMDRLEKLELFCDGGWARLFANIETEHFTLYNSDLDERAWPPMRWRVHEDEDLEIWPIPNRDQDPVTLDGTLRFTGIRNLNPLVADTDRCDLDSRIIVLFAAAETLGASGAKDAQMKLDQANSLLAKQTAGFKPRRKFAMFGVSEQPARGRPFIHSYRPPIIYGGS